MQFQCLASQNTLAALIRGTTFHSWASIPVNLSDALGEGKSKTTKGYVDDFYLRCLSLFYLSME